MKNDSVEVIAGRSGGNARARGNNHHNDRPLLWTQKQFQYKADKIAEWKAAIKASKKLTPIDADYHVIFTELFEMSWDYWVQERDRHMRAFTR